MRIPPLRIDIMLESNPLKSIISVREEIGRKGYAGIPEDRRTDANARDARAQVHETHTHIILLLIIMTILVIIMIIIIILIMLLIRIITIITIILMLNNYK